METGKRRLLGMTLSELKEVVQALGMPSFAGGQMAKRPYQRQMTNIGEMTDILKPNHERLTGEYEIGYVAHIDAQYSKDGTTKRLFPIASRKFVETVFIPDGDRAILCVSCQVGYKINCLFCQTGKQGFEGNLTYADILNQAYSLLKCGGPTNIVFAGQGEPMDNSDNILRVTQVVTTDYGHAWSLKRITANSVGVKDKSRHFLDESNCHVAVSLHSALPEQRSMLMPAEKSTSIEQTVNLLYGHGSARQRRLPFEYIAFGGLSDTPMHARRIIDLPYGLDCRVNSIHFHQVPSVPLRGADEQKMESFRNYLTSHGVLTTIRASCGQDIFATCGLLSMAKKAGVRTDLIG